MPDLVQEITEIVRAEVEKSLQGIKLPETFTLDLINNPNIKVEIPKLDFTGLEKAFAGFLAQKKETLPPINFSSLELLLKGISDKIIYPDNSVVLGEILQELSKEKKETDFTLIEEKIEELIEAVKSSVGKEYKVAGGGGGWTYLTNVSGTPINPATEEKQDTLIATDFATETTLASIKDTDGIKKITDELPAGTQKLGMVNVLNVANDPINPATEEKQDDVITKLGDNTQKVKTSAISTDNSSTTPLDNGQVFTGTWEDVSEYASITIPVKTDQDGVYSLQFSPDGTNQDSTLTRYYRTSQIEPPHAFKITRQFARVVFTNNSGSNQTYFRLQTLLGEFGQLNAPTDSVLAQDYDAIVTRPTDFRYEIALGRRQGYELWNKFGYNEDVDTGTDPEPVFAFGGTGFTPLTTASTLTIVSSSDQDSDTGGSVAQGTGARTIRVTGIDANRNKQEEDFIMDGTTSFASTSTWLGINRVVVLTSGTSNTNVGLITITATTGGSTQATLPIGGSVTQQLVFFNYANYVGLADWLQLSAKRFGAGTEPVVTFKGWVYSPLTGTKYEVLREILNTTIETDRILVPSQPFVFTEQDVFWIEAETTRDDTSVTGRFSLITVRDVDA